MSVLTEMFRNLSLVQTKVFYKMVQPLVIPVRYKIKERKTFTVVPEPGKGKCYRRMVHFPSDYTVKPLDVTNLGGRDPVTGRKVCNGIGGGIKYKYHWVKWFRDGPAEGPPQEEKVIKIMKCHHRTAFIALVAVGSEMKYILATENMKEGDIIRTSRYIPQNPVRPNEGDAYPVGALPMGTVIHNIQLHPTTQTTIIHSAGSSATIKQTIDNKIIVRLPSKKDLILEPECMVTVGKLSNAEHMNTPIGSAQRARELGFRPRSGLKQRKTGRLGRKIKPLTRKVIYSAPKEKIEIIQCTDYKIKS